MSWQLQIFTIVSLHFLIFIGTIQSQSCLGEFELCPSSGECVMSPKSCGKCRKGQYVCPISKSCVDSVNDYMTCPQINGTHLDWTLPLNDRLHFLLNNLSLDEKWPQLTNQAPEIYRLGIPFYNYLNDDEHGVRNSHATDFPNGNGLGATWSKQDLFTVANITAYEARALHNALVHEGNRGKGQNGDTITIYAPFMNLIRDPRWGRSQEIFSECPLLSSKLTHAMVNGLQQMNMSKYLLTAACCTDFLAYDLESQPVNRHYFNAIVDAVNYAESYTPVFRECIVKAKAAHLMCSYNSINGVPSCGNNYTLNTQLRDEWKFEGFVVSDYDAVAGIYTTHKYVNTMEEAVAVAFKAGCDQEGGGTTAITHIPNAIKDGLLSIDDVNRALSRAFRVRIRLGLFDPPTMVKYNYLTNDSSVEGEAHLNASRLIAAHSMVLYKNNNNILPLNVNDIKGLAVIGPQAIRPTLLMGNYANYPDKGIATIMQALRESLNENTTARCTYLENTDFFQPGAFGTTVYSANECCSLCFNDDQCFYWTFYENICYLLQNDTGYRTHQGVTAGQCLNNPTDSKVHNSNGCSTIQCSDDSGFAEAITLIDIMHQTDKLSAIIVLLGLDQSIESEGHDRTTIELPGMQNDLVTTLYNNGSSIFNVPLICVLIHGGTLALGSAATDCDVIIDAWYPGSQGMYGLSDILFGRINPAGRAPVTSYKSTSELIPPGQMNEYYGNGITYRYYKGEPLYPFGFGMSFSNFTYSNVRLNVTKNSNNNINASFIVQPCDIIGITVTVTNIGPMDGDEVVQLYIIQKEASVQAPNLRLGDFERIFIANGKAVDVNLILTPRYHSVVYNNSSPAYYKPDIQIEKGVFDIYIGGGQPKYYKNTLTTSIYVNDTVSLLKCDEQS